MRILLTGATGFIGRNLAVELSNMGYHVRCLVRDMERALWMDRYPGLEPVRGDIVDTKSMVPHVRGVDLVFHLAGLTKAKSREEFFMVNGRGTGNLVDAITRGEGEIKKIVYVSSLAVAGPHTPENPAREDGEAKPITHYGESKLLGEVLLKEKSTRIPWTIMRPPVVYGPYDRDLFIYFKMAKAGFIPLLGKGMSLSMIHADDVTAGIIMAGLSERSNGEVYYLSDGKAHAVEYALKTLAGIVGRGRIIRLPAILGKAAGLWGDMATRLEGRAQVINSQKVKEALQEGWVCSIDKIREHLGFHPEKGLVEGFESTYLWYRNTGWL